MNVSTLPALPDFDRLSERCIRINGGNPGKFTLQGTNTYLIGTGRERILVDTGQGFGKWLQVLKKILAVEKATIRDVLITHWHSDHVGGNKDVLALCPNAKLYKNAPGVGEENLLDGSEFKVEGATVRAYHTPGHTTDHMCFLLLEEDALLTGDNVLGHGTSVYENLAVYMDSLHRMRSIFKGRAYPGHGAVAEDGPALITQYIEHRAKREHEVTQKLQSQSNSWTAMGLVKAIYTTTPPELHEAASKGVQHILVKLEREGKIVAVSGQNESTSWIWVK
ncbi:hypothetical protein Cpir12675_001862 [Ceratocystis pirilliformis]|uniref:Metallo-beta-lactamase domain-containing protein n=1 Tax=Ceratocystis pirilliformis TaxID=259994 RepID=A0ABR3ZD92_9PEZI